MNRPHAADAVSEAVIAYCDALRVPVLDEAAIAARPGPRARGTGTPPHARGTGTPMARPRLRIAAAVAIGVALLVCLCAAPAVFAGAQRILRAFTLVAGRPQPMTVRVVGLERARADAGFVVIPPPPIAGAPSVTVEEFAAGASRAATSVVFEIRGHASGSAITIVESNADRAPARTLLSTDDGRAGARGAQPGALAPPVRRHRPGRHAELYGVANGEPFEPVTWVARGTRIVLVAPPGTLSPAQVRAIRRAMSG